jgi:hypothetical protein
MIAQDAATHAKHHRAVASDKRREGNLISLGEKSLQELTIVYRAAAKRRTAQIPDGAADVACRHDDRSLSGRRDVCLLPRKRRTARRFFFFAGIQLEAIWSSTRHK